MKFKYLSIIFFSCLILIGIIDFTNLKIPEIYDGIGQKFEGLIRGICFAFVAAFIFYYLNTYLKEKREKKAIYPLIARNVMGIIVNNQSIITALRSEKSVTPNLTDQPSKDEFKELLIKVNPKDKSPLYYKNENWIYLFQNRQKSTLKTIDKIFMSGKHVDEELRTILLKMQSSLYLKEDYAFNSQEFEEQDLSKYSLVFFKYFELIRALKEYFDKNLKSFYHPFDS